MPSEAEVLSILERAISSGDQDLVAIAICLFLDFEEGRYSVERSHHIPKSIEWRAAILFGHDERRFRQQCRMSKRCFNVLVGLLGSHPGLSSDPRAPGRKQLPIDVQLAIFLSRLGNNQPVAPRMIIWPTGASKEATKAAFQQICGMDCIVGAVDGTHIRLKHRPRVENADKYFNRHDDYSINVMAVVDHRKVFTAIQVGYPGSNHDSKVYQASAFYSQRSQLLRGAEAILGDSAYPMSSFLVKPFRRQPGMEREHRNFNFHHARGRIVVENAFARLKQLFPILRDMPILDLVQVSKVTTACFALCNFVTLQGDTDWLEEEIDQVANPDDDDEGDDDIAESANPVALRNEGIRKRDRLVVEVMSFANR